MSYNVSGARRSAAVGLQKCYTQYFEVMAQNVSRFFFTRKKSGPRSEHASDEACTGCCMKSTSCNEAARQGWRGATVYGYKVFINLIPKLVLNIFLFIESIEFFSNLSSSIFTRKSASTNI